MTREPLTDRQIHLAYFITPHGFGHAARAAAVMAAIHRVAPNVCSEIFTTVPPWFSSVFLTGPYVYHPCVTDVGLVHGSDSMRTVDRRIFRL